MQIFIPYPNQILYTKKKEEKKKNTSKNSLISEKELGKNGEEVRQDEVGEERGNLM